jgi:hypothetical protein
MTRIFSVHVQGPPKICIHSLTDGICVLFSKLNYLYNMEYGVFSTDVATRMTVRSCDV